MPRLMSVSHTEAAVVARTKTVTRRLGWRNLTPGTRLTLCRKVMGRRRPDGTVEPLVRLVDVEVVSVRREPLLTMTDDDVPLEGVPVDGRFEEVYDDTGQPPATAWVTWFCEAMGCLPDTIVTRIEWRYLDDGSGGAVEGEPLPGQRQSVEHLHLDPGRLNPTRPPAHRRHNQPTIPQHAESDQPIGRLDLLHRPTPLSIRHLNDQPLRRTACSIRLRRRQQTTHLPHRHLIHDHDGTQHHRQPIGVAP